MHGQISKMIVVVSSMVVATAYAGQENTVTEVSEGPLTVGLLVRLDGAGDEAGPSMFVRVGDGNKSIEFLVDQSSDVSIRIGSIVGDHAVRIWGTQEGTDVLSGLIDTITRSGAASKHLLDLPLKVTVSPLGRVVEAVAVFHEEGEEGEEDREILLLYAGGDDSEGNEADGARVLSLLAVETTGCSASPPSHTCSCSASGPKAHCSSGTTTDGTNWSKCTDATGTMTCTAKGGSCDCSQSS